MELDEMKQAWDVLNQRLERQHAVNLGMFRESRLDKVRRRLRPLLWGQVFQIGVGAVFMLLFGSYWVDHIGTPHLMIYGLVLHAYGLMSVIVAARNLYLQSRLDYGAPVLEIQHRIAHLRAWRLREGITFGAAWCFMWIPLILIVFQQAGADVWIHAPAVVWGNLASGVICLAVMVGVIRWSRIPGHERFRAALENNSIGRSVRRTQAMLDEIARFERD